jgi:hypothetical protein
MWSLTSAEAVSATTARSVSALSRGLRVPPSSVLRVHSIFERTANLERSDRRLLVLADVSCANVPHGVRLPASDWRALRAALRLGDTASLAAQRLHFPRAEYVVDLTSASRWHIDLMQIGCDWSNARVREAFTSACAILRSANARSDDPLARAYARLLARIVPDLERALRTLHSGMALEGLGRLLGTGPGLTPSGDDFVVGMLAGLAVCAQSRQQLLFLDDLCRGVNDARVATTPISQQHLSDACHLHFAQPLAELAVAIASGVADVTPELTAALAVGAHSGTDGVAGLLFALRAWRPVSTQAAFHSADRHGYAA